MFPDSPRVIYRKNPLEEVICQLRFPEILRIDAELPASFQDSIRKEYPLFREHSADQLRDKLPPEVVRLFAGEMSESPRAFDFLAADESWKVGLTRGFLSLSTTHYVRWEEFRDRLNELQRVLIDNYAPAFYARVGLRYKNVIRRSAIGDPEVAWHSLLESHILGEIGCAEVNPRIVEAARRTTFSAAGEWNVRLQHGLRADEDETVYVIDSDFFRDARTEISDVSGYLNEFNRESGRLFRWCVTRPLHEAMDPQPVG